jgi:hypothetical protein
LRRYIFTDRERRLLEDWIETAEETGDLPRILSWIRQGWPGLADDMTLLFKTVRTMMRRRRWRGYVTRGSEFGSALRRAEYALTRARSV